MSDEGARWDQRYMPGRKFVSTKRCAWLLRVLPEGAPYAAPSIPREWDYVCLAFAILRDSGRRAWRKLRRAKRVEPAVAYRYDRSRAVEVVQLTPRSPWVVTSVQGYEPWCK